jgi:hypothetical protein
MTDGFTYIGINLRFRTLISGAATWVKVVVKRDSNEYKKERAPRWPLCHLGKKDTLKINRR